MADNIGRIKRLLKKVLDETIANRVPDNEAIGNDALALVKNRIIRTGEFADGKQRRYSNSYSKQRSRKGRQTRFVDLSYSGRMWANTHVRTIRRRPFGTIVRVEGRNIDTKNKIRYNTNRYGVNILELTEKEVSILRRNKRRQLEKRLRKLR